MTNKERLFTIVREHYAIDVAHTDRLRELYSQIGTARDHLQMGEVMRLWDIVALEVASYERHFALYEQESLALYEVTPPDEFTPDEHKEMKTLIRTGVKLSGRLMEQLKELRLLPPVF